MKPSLLTLAIIFCCCTLFAQNENPYAQFGYQAAIMPEQSKPKMEHQVDRLYIINQDSTDAIAIVALDAINRNITFYDKNRQVLNIDTLTNYTLARWISPDPYGQFSSPYLSMGNNPINGVDPDGGWSSRDAFLIGFGVGAAGTAIIAKHNGANDMSAFGLALLGGLAVGGGAAWLNNVGHFPSLPDGFKFPPLNNATTNLTIQIVNGSQKNWGGKLGGHVALVVDGKNQGFTNGTTPGGSRKNLLGIDKDTWNGPGKYDESAGLGRGDIRWDVPVTEFQVKAMKEEIAKIQLAPPRYKTLGQKCASVAARILRAGNIIGKDSRFYQESPFQLRKYLTKELPKSFRKY